MNIRLKKGTIAAIAGASLIAGTASAAGNMNVRDLGSAAKLRSSLINNIEVAQAAPYAGSEAKAGEAKCGEGKCGDETKKEGEGKCGEGKCGDHEKKGAEGKCGEGKCGEGKCGDEGE